MVPHTALFVSSAYSAASAMRHLVLVGPTHPLAQPDGATAAGAYHPRQQPVGLGLLGVVLDSMVEVLELLGAGAPRRRRQGGQLGPCLVALGLPLCHHLQQRADLAVVVCP